MKEKQKQSSTLENLPAIRFSLVVFFIDLYIREASVFITKIVI